MPKRFVIDVRAQRFDQPPYTYIQHERVKVGKVQRLLDATALDIARHEGRGEHMPQIDWGLEDDFGFCHPTITIGGCTFTVRATPLIGGE